MFETIIIVANLGLLVATLVAILRAAKTDSDIVNTVERNREIHRQQLAADRTERERDRWVIVAKRLDLPWPGYIKAPKEMEIRRQVERSPVS